jgi:trehalose 6-phosphate phosphatase
MDDLLGPFRRAPESAGLFLDFDGTLANIETVPSAARPVAGVSELLDDLTVKFRLVAIVSGRSASDLLEWLGPEVEIWGTHGAERTRSGTVELSERVLPYKELMARVRNDARRRIDELGIEGIILEDKRVMVALHFRAADDVERARDALDAVAADLAAGYGLVRAGGRLAFELRPPIELSKHQVVLQRAREASLRAAAFVGDDRVDIPAFEALDQLAREGATTVRVAVSSAEVPQELIDRADLVVEGPRGVVELLRSLL